MKLTTSDIDLLIEALARSASRLESYARYLPNSAHHARKAEAMRRVRQRLVTERNAGLGLAGPWTLAALELMSAARFDDVT